MDASGEEITPGFGMTTESNSFVDQVTLELLVNKSQYHKLVSKNNPEEGNKIQSHYNEIAEYKDIILELTEELLTNRYKNVSTEVNDMFDGYIKAVINHYKMKEIESNNDYNKYDEVDTMFDKMHEEPEHVNVDKSVWGKSIVKRKKY
jgi:hypothetical protein